MLGSNVATSSSVTSLTTFLSSVVVASLFSEWNSFSLAWLFYWPSSAVASTQATFLWTPLRLSAAELSAVVWNKRVSQWQHRYTRPSMWSRQKHFREMRDSDIMDQSLPTTSLLQGRRVSLSELRYLMERWQKLRRTETNWSQGTQKTHLHLLWIVRCINIFSCTDFDIQYILLITIISPKILQF